LIWLVPWVIVSSVFEKHLRNKAANYSGLTPDSTLKLIPVPYNNQTHTLQSFSFENSATCLG
jgi:hypothetical protein